MISFLLNDEAVHLSQCRPDLTVLDFLREHNNLKGTKEGCASGDCGACTVVLAEKSETSESLEYTAINSCITFMSALHGKQLITVEHISDKGKLHQVQQGLLDNHATQCGFCTPGFVMSMFAYYHSGEEVDRSGIERALSGNLCRCTGYRPIIDAAASACSSKTPDKFTHQQSDTLDTLKSFDTPHSGVPGLYMPRSREELAETLDAFPNAKIVAGSTDLALETTQKHIALEELISLAAMPGLNEINVKDETMIIGANVSLSQFERQIEQSIPQLVELIRRFASRPIRNQATVAGNIANASPIGDLPPVLLALDGAIILDNGIDVRKVKANDFFTGYRETAKLSDEWISHIELPIPNHLQQVRAYKVSKREEDDISAVCAVFKLCLDEGKVADLSTGFGGVAAIPEQASQLLDTLQGKDWADIDTMQEGKSYLLNCFNPISDVRASAEYRRNIVANLWHRFWLETNYQENQIETRVVSHA